MHDIAVATMTRVAGGAEERLVTRALQVLNGTGLPIAVCDGGSPASFLRRVSRLQHVIMAPPASGGLVAQVQSAVATARRTRRRWILYTEPDKLQFFARDLAGFVDRALRRRAPIVLASRSAAAFATFPEIQRLAETAANDVCRDVIGLDADFFYGPFVFSAALHRVVARAPHRLGWGWRPFFFAAARRQRMRIAAEPGEYRCPRNQRDETERDRAYRIRQLTDNVRGLLAAFDVP
jgi:hypothetical protein